MIEQEFSGVFQEDLLESSVFSKLYKHPEIGLLNLSKAVSVNDLTDELKNYAQIIVDTLKSFGVQTRIMDISRGPSMTRYEIQPMSGVKISKIIGLAGEIALNLASSKVTIAPIPNRAVIGVDVPNKVVIPVNIREVIDTPEFQETEFSLPVALGKDITGSAVIADIAKMPHMLISGSTGSGKSACINSIIMSLLYRSSPENVKLLMVDPKAVELGVYNGIPHLLIPVVTNPKKAVGALNWAVIEMLRRYKEFADNSVRDLSSYNRLALENEELKPMPKIVIIIDELADIMMAAPNEVEDSICHLAQMGRVAGIHIVIATQQLIKNVITDTIKSNIPSRVAFAVPTPADSRAILGVDGAEKLSGCGDMLFYTVGFDRPIRVHGCYVSPDEEERVAAFIKENDNAAFNQLIAEEIERYGVAEKPGKINGFDDEDEMLPQAIECVIEAGMASTSQIQRRLKLGYARAARIIDQLEERGIVGPFEGSKPRQVLISMERWVEMKLSGIESTVHKDTGLLDLQTQPAQPRVAPSQRKEVIATGKTVDIAIESACLRLGCKREHCKWEIFEQPQKGFLRLKNAPAKVRVWYEN